MPRDSASTATRSPSAVIAWMVNRMPCGKASKMRPAASRIRALVNVPEISVWPEVQTAPSSA